MYDRNKHYTVSKQFDFCYSHIVWNQELNPFLSMDSECKCRNLHGHNAKVVIHLRSENLYNGMVLDFNNLKIFKNWIDTTLDHALIIDKNDPYFGMLSPMFKRCFRIDCVPTSENLAKILFDQFCQIFTGAVNQIPRVDPLYSHLLGVELYQVDFWESDTGCASYHAI